MEVLPDLLEEAHDARVQPVGITENGKGVVHEEGGLGKDRRRAAFDLECYVDVAQREEQSVGRCGAHGGEVGTRNRMFHQGEADGGEAA